MNFEEMYRDYQMSTQGVEMLLEDYGYLTFQLFEGNAFMRDIYVVPDLRKQPINDENPAIKLINGVLTILKERGIARAYSKLEQTNPKKNSSLRFLIATGFKLSHNEHHMVVMCKEL